MKVEVNSYGSLLVPLLNAKLPKELNLIIARNFEDDVRPLEDMMKVLKNEIQAKERSLSVGTSFDLSDNYCGGDQSFSEDDYTLSALLNSSHKQSKKQCPFFLDKNYYIFQTTRFNNTMIVLEKDLSMIETRRLEKIVIFFQTILSFVLSRKIINVSFVI